MKLLLVYMGFVGFMLIWGGVGGMETGASNLLTGSLICIGGFIIIAISLCVKKHIDSNSWEKRFKNKKRKRLGLA